MLLNLKKIVIVLFLYNFASNYLRKNNSRVLLERLDHNQIDFSDEQIKQIKFIDDYFFTFAKR